MHIHGQEEERGGTENKKIHIENTKRTNYPEKHNLVQIKLTFMLRTDFEK